MKIALITGGSRGLGRDMATAVAAKGSDVIVTFHRQAGEAEEVVDAVRATGRRAARLQLDVGDSASFGAFADALSETLRKVFDRDTFDYLVNNAGVGLHAPISETNEEQFDLMMRVHLKGPFFLTQALLPLMADGGRIVNISSGLARFSLPGYAAYASMKGGLEVLSRYMAKELGPRRITVNVVAPGAVETDFGGGAVRDNAQLNRAIASETSLGRVGLPSDIGGVVSSLLSDDMGWVNGQRIEVTGGIFL